MLLIVTLVFFVFYLQSSAASESPCQLSHAGRPLKEGESLEVKGKIYKVEGCALHRAYHACGTHIFHIVNIVCQALDNNHAGPRRKKRVPRYLRQKLLTEACCQSVCTVSEMTRYCPWRDFFPSIKSPMISLSSSFACQLTRPRASQMFREVLVIRESPFVVDKSNARLVQSLQRCGEEAD